MEAALQYTIFVVIVIFFIIVVIILVRNVSGKTTEVEGYADIDDPYQKPFILTSFLTPDHCQEIIDYSRDKLRDSKTVVGLEKKVRNSQQYWIPKSHPLAKPLFEHISKKFNIPIENAEDLQVVRYLPGQYYNEHHDACCDDNEYCREFVKKGGQRKLTVLVYLNDKFENGHTYFRNLDLKIKPPQGDAIVFFPLSSGSSKCHHFALHAGMPVTKGEKWIANLWFREGVF